MPRSKVWLAERARQTSYSPTGFVELANLFEGNTLVRVHMGLRWWLQRVDNDTPHPPDDTRGFLYGLIVTQGDPTVPTPPNATIGTEDWLHWEQAAWQTMTWYSTAAADIYPPYTYVYADAGPQGEIDIQANRRIDPGNFGKLWLTWQSDGPVAQPPLYARAEYWARMLVLA